VVHKNLCGSMVRQAHHKNFRKGRVGGKNNCHSEPPVGGEE